jgi:UDPglucose 6-dehydrogenase
MKITIIGTGYVGLVAGVGFADFGIEVVCLDKNEEKIRLLNDRVIPIHEPGLQEAVNKYIGNNLFFSSNKKDLNSSNVIIIAVGTPSKADGSADLSYLESAIADICEHATSNKTIIIKSTVPIGTAAMIRKKVSDIRPDLSFDIISNPEFLREGSAVYDFLNPDRIVIGVIGEEAKETSERLYGTLKNKGVPILFTDNNTAEIIKYAANCFLATRVAFINEIADICEKVGANIEEVSSGMGYDKRIGRHYLNAGPGFGGSCFPKDTMALNYTSKAINAHSKIIDAVIKSNDIRKRQIAKKISGSLQKENCKTVAILGVTFKADTDDLRDSAALVIVPYLINRGFEIKVYDPSLYLNNEFFSDTIVYSDSLEQALDQSDAAVIITEWSEFRSMNLPLVKKHLRKHVIYDLRNLFVPEKMREMGFKYYSIGR